MERQQSQRDSVYLHNNRWLRKYLREQELMDINSELMSTEYDRDLYRVAAEVERRVNIQRGIFKKEDELSDIEEDETTLPIPEPNDSDMDNEIIDFVGYDNDDSFSGTSESFDYHGNIKLEDLPNETESDRVIVNEPANENVNNVMSSNNPLYQFTSTVESVCS